MENHLQKMTNYLPHQEKEISSFPPSGNKSRFRLYSTTFSREIIIEHRGEEYRLRLTGKGKLILTK
jgi:hemin uptake protein HemP